MKELDLAKQRQRRKNPQKATPDTSDPWNLWPLVKIDDISDNFVTSGQFRTLAMFYLSALIMDTIIPEKSDPKSTNPIVVILV